MKVKISFLMIHIIIQQVVMVLPAKRQDGIVWTMMNEGLSSLFALSKTTVLNLLGSSSVYNKFRNVGWSNIWFYIVCILLIFEIVKTYLCCAAFGFFRLTGTPCIRMRGMKDNFGFFIESWLFSIFFFLNRTYVDKKTISNTI